MPKPFVQLRLTIRRMIIEFLRKCGIRNMIIILLISLILSYLLSYDRWFNVVMRFCMSTIVNLPPTMQPTRTDENLGEWVEKIRVLASSGVQHKRAYVQSANCSWRLDGIDWYTDDHYYKRIKYVLYCDEYFCRYGSRHALYRLSLVDITSSSFCKFSMTLPCIRLSRVFNFFSHEHFDVETRSKQLQASLYVSVYKESSSCVYSMIQIADYSGVLVSPLLIHRFRFFVFF